jgi:hypothetical protein
MTKIWKLRKRKSQPKIIEGPLQKVDPQTDKDPIPPMAKRGTKKEISFSGSFAYTSRVQGLLVDRANHFI